MKQEQNQLKEAYTAFYELQEKLDKGITITVKIDKKPLTVIIHDLFIDSDGGKWYINDDDDRSEAGCELSKWLEKNFNCCVFDHVAYGGYRKDLKIFQSDLDKIENFYSAKNKNVALFFDSFYHSLTKVKKGTNLETLFKKFETRYNEMVAEKLQREEAAKQREKSKTNPEEFISINGTLVSKEEIKKLAASL